MKTCLFAGTFDPVNIGHFNIVKKLVEKYDKVVVAIGINPDKTPLFSLEDRLLFLKTAFSFSSKIVVDSYFCLTVSYMQTNGIDVLVRGVRNSADLEFERQNEKKSKAIFPSLITEYIFVDDNQNVSSSLIREYIKNKQDFSAFVPPSCHQIIKEKAMKL